MSRPKSIQLSRAKREELLRELARAPAAAVDGVRLIELGEALSRPVLHLIPAGLGKPVAIYGGAVRGRRSARIVLDLRRHPDSHSRSEALLEVDVTGPTFLPDRLLTEVAGGTPLFGLTAMELPSLDALFLHAEELHPWLRQQDWEPDSGFNGNFPEAEVAEKYEEVWAASHPLFSASASWAQIGGWPITWPDQSYAEQVGQTLVVRTYHDAEPWLEVLRRPEGALRFAARIT